MPDGCDSMALDRFLRTYNNIPLAERNLPIFVLEGEPISWKLARTEIEKDTDLGKKIQAKLEKEGFI